MSPIALECTTMRVVRPPRLLARFECLDGPEAMTPYAVESDQLQILALLLDSAVMKAIAGVEYRDGFFEEDDER